MKSRIGLKFVLTLAGLSFCGCHGQAGGTPTSNHLDGAGTCADPIVLEGSATLTAQSTSQAADGVSGDDQSCVGFATHGAERIYKVSVPATDQTKFSVMVTPTDSPAPDAFDPVVYLAKTCEAQPSCLAGQDLRGGGGKESLDFVNTNGQDTTLFLVVDGYDYQPNGGTYDLVAQLGAP